ncbi:MAG: hypothetical protein EXS18_01735 [Verrucomicrobiae bacterium]|nr:hypothetical protein [Verrucomicrobiae bacterium]
MKKVTVLIAGVVLALLAVSCSRSPKVCAVCQRDECKGLAFRVTLDTGRTVETCCPRCGLEYLKNNKLTARQLQATDIASGSWIDAKKAVYVSGSDVSHCSTMEVKRDAQGCCFFKGYDRCQPSVIAFANRDAAAAFQKQHGGSIVDFQSLN